ncbi:MAG: alpha/beta fold hydrolase [Bacteroidota bacterium]
MKAIRILVFITIAFQSNVSVGQKIYTPKIEPCGCDFRIDPDFIRIAPPKLKVDVSLPFGKIDSSFRTHCGYLVVPENRNKKASRLIKLPFVVVESKNPNKKKDPVLFTGGGPGTSSLDWAIGITKSNIIKDRDCIVMEQRGTRYARPYIRNFELDSAIRESYRKNLPKDSMVYAAVRRYKKRLENRGIDLSGYNTEETVSDLHDLLSILKVDSVNLSGISYSGGLMMAVLQKDPSRVRSLVLDSPLPMFIPIDEDEPANFNEALAVLFRHVQQDSTDQVKYGDLKRRFENYFTTITGKVFVQSYLEQGTTDSIYVNYTKNELLSAIEQDMFDDGKRKNIAFMITETIAGRHRPYIKEKLDLIFNRNPAPDGMRISVYCADEAAYHNEAIIQQLYKVYPYMAGYRINDVYGAVCDCWKVPPVNPMLKQAFYSDKPVLLGDGEMDPGCRPLYMDLIHHYMPNGQRFLFLNRSHGIYGKDWSNLVQQFLNNPYKTATSGNPMVVAY